MNRGLYPAPDEEPPVGESPAAASLPRADAPLKPCPFCGGEATLSTWYTDEGDYAVKCKLCNAAMYGYHDQILADLWNRRDGEDARIAEAKAQGAAEEQKRILKAASAASQRREDGMRYILIPVLFEVVLKSEE